MALAFSTTARSNAARALKEALGTGAETVDALGIVATNQ